MKKTRSRKSDDLRPEYDLRKLGPGVRGKYYKRAIAGPIVVELVPTRRREPPRERSALRGDGPRRGAEPLPRSPARTNPATLPAR